MDGSSESILYHPKEGETLEEYIQRYAYDEILQTFEHPEKRDEFCTIIMETRWPSVSEEEEAYQKLWKILKSTENYNQLLHDVEMWEPVRQELLNKLSKFASKLSKISKWCTYGRIFTCSAESLNMIRGLYFTKSVSKSSINWLTVFGVLGIALAAAEFMMTKDTFSKMVNIIERDKELYVNIEKWYQQSEELEEAINNIFPFDYTHKIVNEFKDIVTGDKKFDPVNLLSSLLDGLVKKDKNLKGETKKGEDGAKKEQVYKMIRNLISFTSSPLSKEFCGWIFFRETRLVPSDVLKIVIPYYNSPLRFILCQNVLAPTGADRYWTSWPVFGRLFINGYAIFAEAWRLRNFEVPGVSEMRDLEKRLRYELTVLKTIAKYFCQMGF